MNEQRQGSKNKNGYFFHLLPSKPIDYVSISNKTSICPFSSLHLQSTLLPLFAFGIQTYTKDWSNSICNRSSFQLKKFWIRLMARKKPEFKELVGLIKTQ
jgi:hypothetical protein